MNIFIPPIIPSKYKAAGRMLDKLMKLDNIVAGIGPAIA